MPFTITVEGMEGLQKALQQAPVVLAQWLQKAVVAGAAEVTKRAVRGNVPYKTGRLAQSIGRPPGGLEIGSLYAIVRPATDYAYYVHEGTKPHKIYPKNGKALFWPGAAHPVRVVNHPGTKGNPFMPRLLDLSRADIMRHFQDAVNAALQEANIQ